MAKADQVDAVVTLWSCIGEVLSGGDTDILAQVKMFGYYLD
jgi:hypothetical protein